MGTSQVQGNLWAARAPDYAEIVEQFGRPLYEEVELMTFRAYHAARRKNEPADEGCFRTNTSEDRMTAVSTDHTAPEGTISRDCC